MKKNDTIGYGIERPKQVEGAVHDENCPFYGSLKIHGNLIQGEVVSISGPLSVTIRIARQVYVPKYRRFKKSFSKIHTHNPTAISAKVGDKVIFVGCRPISKTKSTVIVKKVEE
ncbi:MAG: small subunit ribosomal protein S17 [Candidatus Woesearchaeota archaeon]|jgi:small subunit ribosomal protein S17